SFTDRGGRSKINRTIPNLVIPATASRFLRSRGIRTSVCSKAGNPDTLESFREIFAAGTLHTRSAKRGGVTIRLAFARSLAWATATLPAYRAAADVLPPVFDGHIHYNADARCTYSGDEILSRLKRAGIERALISSTPNDGTIALYEKD